MKKTILYLSIPCLLAFSANAQVANGSFEILKVGDFKTEESELGKGQFSLNSSASSWTAGTSAGFYTGPTTDQRIAGWIIPDGLKATQSTLTQTITISAPGIYTLNFDSFTATPNGGNNTGFSAALTGVSSQSFKEIADGSATARSVNFNVTSAGSYDLVFTAEGGAIGDATLIDNVSLSPVPETSSTALIGLGMFYILIRRKK